MCHYGIVKIGVFQIFTMVKFYFLVCLFLALTIGETIGQKASKSPEFSAALKLYQAEKYLKALTAFQKLEAKTGTEGVQAKYYVLECLAQAENWEGVIKKSKEIKATELPPVNRFNYWIKTGDAYFSTGDLEKAQENYTDACAVAEAYKGISAEELSIAYAGLGDVEMKNGSYSTALKFYTKALRLKQNSSKDSMNIEILKANKN